MWHIREGKFLGSGMFSRLLGNRTLTTTNSGNETLVHNLGSTRRDYYEMRGLSHHEGETNTTLGDAAKDGRRVDRSHS